MSKSNDFYLNNPSIPVANAEYEWTPEMIDHLQRSKKDITHFAQNFFYIVHPDHGKQVIKLYKAQKVILKSLQKNKRVIVLASRQSGKTTLMTIYALWLICFNKDKSVLIVANKEKTAIQILGRIRTAYEMLPNWIKPGAKDYAKTGIKLANDSSIDVSTTASTAARGSTCSVLIIDEAAHIAPHIMDEFYKSVIPIVSSGKKTKIFMISTANGTTNRFYDTFKSAERGENGWKSEVINWWDHPDRDDEWKKGAIADLGSMEAFEQEYGNKFVDTGQVSIDKDIIDELKLMAHPATIYADPNYKVWVEPNKKHIYAMGVDTADGVGAHYSVASIFDITDLTEIELVAQYADNKIDPYTFANKVYDMCNQWGRPWLMIENNNQGTQVIQTLINTYKYQNIVDYEYGNDDPILKRRGVYSRNESKSEAVTSMRYWMNTLRVVKIYDIRTIQEMETFIKHPNGTWKKREGENIYDDRIMSVIWCLFILKPKICEKYYDIISYDDKGMPLKIQRNEDTDEKFYGLDIMKREYSDDDALPTLIGLNDKGMDISDLMADGWSLL